MRKITDTSRQGRWHNARFRVLAGEPGLGLTKTASLGWSGTTALGATAADYGSEIGTLEAAITVFRRS